MTQIDDKEMNAFMMKSIDINVDDDVGIVQCRGRLSVTNDKELRKSILVEEHCSKFSIRLRETKMYQDLKRT